MLDTRLTQPEGKTLEFKRDLSSAKPLLKTLVSFDELPMPELGVDDLDLSAARQLFKGISPLDDQALRTLKLLTQTQGRWVPTQGAVLLFGKDRRMHFSDAWVQCGRFVGTDKAVIFDHIDIHDSLPQAVDSIMLFLKKHAMRGADFSEVRRKDVWSIPLTLLREAVINALVHTDYSQRGAPIRIAFFDDRIEIENPGTLVPGLTVEDMRQGVSKIRNHVLARVFRELNLIEQWGSGVRRIFREAQELGLPEPQIVELGLRVRLVVRLAQALPVMSPPATNTEQVTEQATTQVMKLLVTLAVGPLGTKAAMSALGLTHRPTFIQNYLQPALNAGWVEMTQPQSPKSPTQKYRLTASGSMLLKAQKQ